MKLYLKSLVNQLHNYSKSLDKTSILIDKPWALIDEEYEMQKLIFKKDKELILSKNGQVQIGKWEYFPGSKSLLIDRNTDKILCNEAFIDKGVIVLRRDGTENEFFVLANENIVPDLDAIRYLRSLRNQVLGICEMEISDGRLLQLANVNVYDQIGNPVTIDDKQPEDGKYKIAKDNKFYEIKNGRILKVLTETKYVNPYGKVIIIHQQNNSSISVGDSVFISGKKAEDGVFELSAMITITINEGRIIKIKDIVKLIAIPLFILLLIFVIVIVVI